MTSTTGLRSFVADQMSPDRDALTGLPNRALFAELYRYAVGRSERLGLPVVMLTVSLHQIVEIERSHDRAVVDSVRRYSATRMRGMLRASDIAARTADNEFVVVLTDFDRFEDVAGMTERIRAGLAAPYRVLGCGVEVRPVVDLINNPPSNIVEDHPGLNVIDLRDEQLVSHFQPIIDVADGSISGAEALLRWAHPSYGILTAGQFFGVAASGGMLEAIAETALICALEGWGELVRNGPRPAPRLFVNLAPSQLLDRSIVGRLHEMMNAVGLIADDIVVEITEAEIAARFDDLIEVVSELRSTGIRVALDDFGAGHSSLGRLRRLPVDVIKVDHSLVHGCDADARAQALLGSVLSIAQSMGVECIVEGIETKAEAEVVTGMGFRFVQGYQFGHPVAAEHFAAMLQWSELLRTG